MIEVHSMGKTILVCTILAASLGQISTRAWSQADQTDSFKFAMKAWDKGERPAISEGAKDLILSSFKENTPKLSDFGGGAEWRGSSRTLNQTLIIYYLDDLRDLKLGAKLGAPVTGRWMGQMPDMKGSAKGEWRQFSIEESDVKAYPVAEFLSKLQPVLSGSKGELHVVSDPTGAAIILDKQSRGTTEKITVEHAGEHEITVTFNTAGLQSCKDKITIPAGGSLTFHCP